jgi:hypothetical protein
MEIVALNSKIKMFKNSMSKKFLLLVFEKLALWTTG